MSTSQESFGDLGIDPVRKLIHDRLTDVDSCRTARANAVELITSPPRMVKRMRVYDVLTACRHMGDEKARQRMDQAGIGINDHIGDLSAKQHADLIEAMRPYPEGSRFD